jgi:hypothetical protein
MITMRTFIVLGISIAAIGTARGAGDLCEAIALRDVPAIEDPSSILKRGEHDTAITQFRVDKKTGATSYCSHGGYCYLAEALQLTSCRMADRMGQSMTIKKTLNFSPIPLR